MDYEPSRGMKNAEGDNWIPMDASYKQYDVTQPTVDLKAAVPFDAQSLANTIQQQSTVNEQEGWVQNVPQQAIQTALTDYQAQLQNYLTTQQPNATVGDVLGMQSIKVKQIQPLPAGLPYQLIAKQSNFSEIADRLRLKFKYELWSSYYGTADQQLFVVEQPTVKLAGKKLAMSFKPATQKDADLIASYIPAADPQTGQIDPAQLPSTLPGYLIHLTPEFTLDNATVATSTAQPTMGTEMISVMGYKFPGKDYQTTQNLPIAGQYEAIALDLQGVSSSQMMDLQHSMQTTRLKMQDKDFSSVTTQDAFGDLLYATILGWFALNNVQDETMSRQMGVVYYQAPSYGIFQTKLSTHFWFGVPRNVSISGVVMDVDSYLVNVSSRDDDEVNRKYFVRMSGSRGSAMEHLIPEGIYSTSDGAAHGVSAVKSLQLAAAEGQKIYTITQANVETALAAINLSTDIKAEIRSAAYAGKEIITQERYVSYAGSTSAGYIILDPQTGEGAYLIEGGEDGGYLVIAAKYRMLYGPMAWTHIRADRSAAERISYSEAMRNAEHYLEAYTRVCDNQESRASLAAWTYLYWIGKAMIYDANIIKRGPITIPGFGTFDFRVSTLTFEELVAGLTGAAHGDDCALDQ
ncbi:MAG: hypothetical protein IT470_04475 [Pseudomonadales bacterium]|nr:hypothetical protein [Pseudomonadales bacterium]